MSKKKQLTKYQSEMIKWVRLPPDVVETIKTHAQADERSFAYFAEKILINWARENAPQNEQQKAAA